MLRRNRPHLRQLGAEVRILSSAPNKQWRCRSQRLYCPLPVLRRIFKEAGLPAELYSSHSMRRGIATWASANGWDIKGLMGYVGWKDMKSALRYVDAGTSFGGLALRNTSPKHVPLA